MAGHSYCHLALCHGYIDVMWLQMRSANPYGSKIAGLIKLRFPKMGKLCR